MNKLLVLVSLLCFVALAASAGSSDTDFWYEETKGQQQQQKPINTKARAPDVFDSIAGAQRSDEVPADIELPEEQNTNQKPGSNAHVMLQAFDEDGDGLLDSKELAKIDKTAWLNFHKGMTNKVFNALGAAAPDMQQVKREVAERFRGVKKGKRNVPNLNQLQALNPRTLQEQFEQRIKSASHVSQDWRDNDEENTQPHMSLHKRTLEHAKNFLNQKKK